MKNVVDWFYWLLILVLVVWQVGGYPFPSGEPETSRSKGNREIPKGRRLIVTVSLSQRCVQEVTKEDRADGKSRNNLVVSPVGVWSLLALITEGAAGNTESQLKAVLNIPDDYSALRRGYRNIVKAMMKANGTTATLESGNAIFKDLNQPITPEFEYVAESYYKATVRGVDVSKPDVVAAEVNSWVNSTTHGHIPHIVSADDVNEAKMILSNAIFFQGFWAKPFNSTLTVTRPFYGDYKQYSGASSGSKEEEVVAEVPMMYQSGKFRLAYSDSLKAQVLELPYEGDLLSMLVLLPSKGVPLLELFATLQNYTMDSIFQILQTQNTFQPGQDEENEEENIDVFLPRFTLGVVDLFEAELGNLSKLTQMRSYVSKVIHRAEIKVAEEGTVASAATVATINNFNMPTVFRANHPFIFIVVEKSTKAIIFSGKVSNPSLS
ncbi:hypothetical protein J437_LFUL015400 [Ladona fulva]|uniref:Serpin domain-containing protein n=1 Tax=Ladona fulva TaxID=123851 RepID=A0A8K0KK18_LADFU|nr:hypothetical protein J437_LFUL015400 [Ladona fulva]